jgi:hypothetical protein
MVVDERHDLSALWDRGFAMLGAFAVLWLLAQTGSVIALLGTAILACAWAFGYPRLARRREERRELIAWVERNTFPDQSISEWLAGEWLTEANGSGPRQNAPSD